MLIHGIVNTYEISFCERIISHGYNNVTALSQRHGRGCSMLITSSHLKTEANMNSTDYQLQEMAKSVRLLESYRIVLDGATLVPTKVVSAQAVA